MVSVHSFDTAGHADQLGQLLAVHLVVTAQDVVDQFAGRRRGRHGLLGLQGADFAQHGVQVQLLVGAGLFESLLSATAEVEFEFAEHGGGTGDLDSETAQTLAGLGDGRGVHGVSFKKSFVVNLFSDKIL